MCNKEQKEEKKMEENRTIQKRFNNRIIANPVFNSNNNMAPKNQQQATDS